MTALPYSRVVDVTLTRLDKFPTQAGFSTALLLANVAKTGKVDATHRTKLYSSIEEVAVDWVPSDEAYKAASVFFSARIRPKQLKIAYRDSTATEIADELNAIYAADQDWYWGFHTKELNDHADQKKLADWAETKRVLFALGSNDVDTESPSTLAAASIAEYCESLSYDRSPVFYHTDANAYLGAAAWGYASGRNLDRSNFNLAKKGAIDSGQAYTLKFKTLPGIAPVDKSSAVVQAITGFVPSEGISASAGHRANTYVNIGGIDMLVEGSCPSGAFIDEIHAADWLIARTQESVLGVLANNPRIPYTDAGVGTIISGGINPVMRRAQAAGILVDYVDDEGLLQPGFEVSVDAVENILASQRRNRIAPDIRVRFRYSGAIHYSSVNLIMQF